MSTDIYVLKLKNGKYYVGKSNDVSRRFQEHVNGVGSSWTKKYKPICIEKVIKNVSPFEEDKVVKEYMLKHGIDAVRGGAYANIELSKEHEVVINRELWAATDKCTRCGRDSHFEKDCYAKTYVTTEVVQKYSDNCFRCGRSSHWQSQCYATTDTKGNVIYDDSSYDSYDDYETYESYDTGNYYESYDD